MFTQALLQPAVLSFKNAGVTDVTTAQAGTSAAIFTQVAAQQNYKPQYLLSSDTVALPNASGADAPNDGNLNGAVNVTAQAYGEETAPGFKPAGGTQKCNAIFKGQTTTYKSLDGYEGATCNYLWYVQAILNHASSLKAAACRPWPYTRWGPSTTPIPTDQSTTRRRQRTHPMAPDTGDPRRTSHPASVGTFRTQRGIRHSNDR